MEQRDYLLRQIQMMTDFLLALIRKLTGIKDSNPEEERRDTTDVMLKEQLDTSLSEIMQIPLDEIVDYIIKRKGIDRSNIDLFAEILILNAEAETNLTTKNQLLKRALELLRWADESGGVYSVERHQKMNEIIRILR
jgi:predicted metal-binding transcription factor (methanogenesis marker protein 9)